MTPMWHPMWDPLWEAVNETQLPLHFHTFPATDPELRKSLEPSISRRMTYSGLVRFQMTLATILTDLMGAAVFERFPNIRMVLGESGIGWIPYVIDRMDFEYKDQYQDLKLKKLPSEYWRNQCRATFQYDRVGTKLIEDMGVETLMWGSDFPHPDGVWPESKKYIDDQFKHLPPDIVYKMTCENAGKFYGLIN
jgi:predicted TIM-barrel fold metal-dependent hydrolase